MTNERSGSRCGPTGVGTQIITASTYAARARRCPSTRRQAATRAHERSNERALHGCRVRYCKGTARVLQGCCKSMVGSTLGQGKGCKGYWEHWHASESRRKSVVHWKRGDPQQSLKTFANGPLQERTSCITATFPCQGGCAESHAQSEQRGNASGAGRTWSMCLR
jgi:hypothetical protein